ncbi:TIGR03643 family protein [uncultured Paraglaciecola sp.]|uniref:TIGR03643 family protein n=1 Tax=uncultured Paraglaciecola sp. TaxID=1765024 RepID=UPI0030DA0532|tara:strand:- start:12971 stop:13246 length:276 start_codon:yes stop_codon:yes gene_type:complete
MKKYRHSFNTAEKSRIIEMAWEDRTPFEAIERLFALNSNQLVSFMRSELKLGSFKVWRKRMGGRQTKHLSLRPAGILRGYCKTQYKHSRGK